MDSSRDSNVVIVIGAGPYGLSVAAHLRGRNVPTRIFGGPMDFWRRMPAGMFLKSPWSASSLSDPSGTHSLDRFVRVTGMPRTEPIPLPYFLRYAKWFEQELVPHIDQTPVDCLSAKGAGFLVTLADGRRVEGRRVILAVGIERFAYVPDFARALPAALASHSTAHSGFAGFRDKSVAVVGAGQSGLESAALLYEAGAEVELITRRRIIWISRRLYEHTGPLKHLFYPPTDVGPPGLNWLIAFPLIVRRLPEETRWAIRRRAMRPAGAKWLRHRVDGRITTTMHTAITSAKLLNERVRLELSDGTARIVDHLVMGTGFRPDVRKITFLDAALRARVASRHGFPTLNEWFESSVPGLHFIGGVAGNDFGPLCNFVAGAGLAARQVAKRAAAAA